MRFAPVSTRTLPRLTSGCCRRAHVGYLLGLDLFESGRRRGRYAGRNAGRVGGQAGVTSRRMRTAGPKRVSVLPITVKPTRS